MLSFIKDFNKKMEKMENVSTSLAPPEFWTSIGNYAVNYIVSGSYYRAIPQGRITCIAGPSGSGKSFLICNFLRQAQQDGCFVLFIDSEHAIDPSYLSRSGVKMTDDKFKYLEADTFSSVTGILSEFIGMYENAYSGSKEKPKVIIALDSIDQLLTDTEEDNFDKGIQKGDQGQRSKQQKQLLRTITQKIKRLPFSFILAHQVYPNQDVTNGNGKWIVNNGLRYACSQIFMVESLTLKEDTKITGVRMAVTNYKSRFTMKGAKTEIEVPFNTGIDKYSGLLEVFVNTGVIKKNGGWYNLEYPGQPLIKFQESKFDDELFEKCMRNPVVIDSEAIVQDRMDFDPEAIEVEVETS
jgi:RecA/RadA recombinase